MRQDKWRAFTLAKPWTKQRNDPKKMSRKEAVEAGANKYWTGVPCAHGHVDFRRVDDRQCCSCLAEKNKRQKAEKHKDPDMIRAMSKRKAAELEIESMELAKEIDYLSSIDI